MSAAGIKEFFRQLPSKLDAEAAEDLDAVYQFELSGAQGGQYVVTIREGACQVTGRMFGQNVTGRSYVELVGYDRSHEDLQRARLLGVHEAHR